MNSDAQSPPETDGRRSIGAKRNPESAEAILEAAEVLLREEGYSGFSIEAVARRARAGKPTIYRWWPSKAALLLDVYQRQKRDVVYPDTGSLEEDLFLFLRSLLKQWRETPVGQIFRSIVAEAQSDPKAAAALESYSAERRRHSGRIIDRAIERGEARHGVDPQAAIELVTAYAWVRLLTGTLDVDDDALRAVVRNVARGVLS